MHYMDGGHVFVMFASIEYELPLFEDMDQLDLSRFAFHIDEFEL